ncbi:MAG TPA: hypothetical protein VGC70_11460 [Burkholderiales bacterium]
MFYAKWFGQVLLIVMLIGSIGLLPPSLEGAAVMMLIAMVWAMWLLISLVRYLTLSTTAQNKQQPRSQ